MTIVSSGLGGGRYPAFIGYTPASAVTSFVATMVMIPRN